jgi:hypothetical protein
MNSHIIPENHRVTAKFMAGEEASAIAEAACVDNPGARVEDHGSYLSISNEQRLDFNIPTIVEELGRPYDMPALLVVLASYSGEVELGNDRLSIKEAFAN